MRCAVRCTDYGRGHFHQIHNLFMWAPQSDSKYSKYRNDSIANAATAHGMHLFCLLLRNTNPLATDDEQCAEQLTIDIRNWTFEKSSNEHTAIFSVQYSSVCRIPLWCVGFWASRARLRSNRKTSTSQHAPLRRSEDVRCPNITFYNTIYLHFGHMSSMSGAEMLDVFYLQRVCSRIVCQCRTLRIRCYTR